MRIWFQGSWSTFFMFSVHIFMVSQRIFMASQHIYGLAAHFHGLTAHFYGLAAHLWSRSTFSCSRSTFSWSRNTIPWYRNTIPWYRNTIPWYRNTNSWSRNTISCSRRNQIFAGNLGPRFPGLFQAWVTVWIETQWFIEQHRVGPDLSPNHFFVSNSLSGGWDGTADWWRKRGCRGVSSRRCHSTPPLLLYIIYMVLRWRHVVCQFDEKSRSRSTTTGFRVMNLAWAFKYLYMPPEVRGGLCSPKGRRKKKSPLYGALYFKSGSGGVG